MAIRFKGCARCGGDVLTTVDVWGERQAVCIQCGGQAGMPNEEARSQRRAA
jgi:hypothetical protein